MSEYHSISDDAQHFSPDKDEYELAEDDILQELLWKYSSNKHTASGMWDYLLKPEEEICWEEYMESVGQNGQDDPELEMLDDAIHNDDKKEFISISQHDVSLFQQKGQEILVAVCMERAFKCARALLKGETPLDVDINGLACGMFPIHYAACTPAMAEFLLYYGAQANVRAYVNTYCLGPVRGPKLPIYIPLDEISQKKHVREWNLEDSIFKLLTILCLGVFQRCLEAVELLASNTTDKELEEEVLQCARDGQLIHIVALLVVAHKRLKDPPITILKALLSLHSNGMVLEDKSGALSALFEVFVRAGDAIENFIKQNKSGTTILQLSKEVACLLLEAGFALKCSDTDLTRYSWYHESYVIGGRTRDEDCHMPHYGKSGYRWMIFSKPTKLCHISSKEGLDQQKFGEKVDELLSMEDKLDEALISDNKKEFLSIIDDSRSLFQLKGQELLEKACKYRALECAAVLLNGETFVILDINGRTSDKMFPIHHAANTCHPSITELFLCYGARADSRADVHSICCPTKYLCLMPSMQSLRRRLPLYITVHKMWQDDAIRFCYPSVYNKDSVFTLITAICLPRYQNHLETIALLAQNSNDAEIEWEFWQCARTRELQHMAILLVVAHKKLRDPMEAVLKSLYSLDRKAKIHENEKSAMPILFEVFLRAGDSIEAYVKKEKAGVTIHQTCKDVACLLQEAGFALKRADNELNGFGWFRSRKYDEREWRCKPEDSGMPHYGKSGYRWLPYGKSSESHRILGKQLFHSQAGGDGKSKDQTSRFFPCLSSGYISQQIKRTKAIANVEVVNLCASFKVSPNKPWLSFASAAARRCF